jgi:uncharacterized membrane protein YoaK (UPF0700 family)
MDGGDRPGEMTFPMCGGPGGVVATSWFAGVPGPLRDAWGTLLPDREGRDGPLPPMLVGLTVVTGIVDAFCYLGLGHVFVANMTGNVVFIAFALAGVAGFSLAASLVAIGSFALGALVGGRLGRHLPDHRGRLLSAATGLETLLVAASFAYGEIVEHPLGGTGRYVLIVLLGIAMGTQNATSRRLAVADLTTTVLTLTLTGISADGRIAGGRDSRIGRRLVSILSMFVGALVGAAIVRSSSPVLTLIVAAGVLGIVAAAASIARRSEGAWVGST